MPQPSYKAFPLMLIPPSQPPVPSLTKSGRVNLEAPDPADIYAQRYRQHLPPHPSTFEPRRPPPPIPSSFIPNKPRESSSSRPSRSLQMPPLADIGRHTSPSPKRHARNASNASRRTRQSLPSIEEVPDLDTDSNSISSGNLSRSSSSGSASSDVYLASLPVHCTSEIADEYMKMNRREAAVRASMQRTSWMVDEAADKGRGSRDLVEHINYVLSAWQRER